MPSRITLRDIAAKAGLHFTTVSLALRGDPRILPATRERILAIADELGYRPDMMLSALSSIRHRRASAGAGTIGFLTTEPVRNLREGVNGTAAAFLAAQAECERQGIALDPIQVNEAGLTPGRVAGMLKARNLWGVILAPMTEPGPFMPLPWEQFCVVAIGYSVRTPALHRVCFHQSRNTRELLKQLRTLGYRRIGMIMNYNSDLRTDNNILGAYLAEQHYHPRAQRLQPLLAPSPNLAEVQRWFAEEQPDCVIGCSQADYDLLQAAGVRIPQDCGFSLVCTPGAGHAGMNENWGRLGNAAVAMLGSLYKANERGLPEHPHYTLIEGEWAWGPSVRAAPMP